MRAAKVTQVLDLTDDACPLASEGVESLDDGQTIRTASNKSCIIRFYQPADWLFWQFPDQRCCG